MFLPFVMTIYLRHFLVQVFGMVNVNLPAMATIKNLQCGRPDKSRGTYKLCITNLILNREHNFAPTPSNLGAIKEH